jgi:hypothetical protein
VTGRPELAATPVLGAGGLVSLKGSLAGKDLGRLGPFVFAAALLALASSTSPSSTSEGRPGVGLNAVAEARREEFAGPVGPFSSLPSLFCAWSAPDCSKV